MVLEDDEDIRRNLHSRVEAAAVVAGLGLRNLVEDSPAEQQERKRN